MRETSMMMLSSKSITPTIRNTSSDRRKIYREVKSLSSNSWNIDDDDAYEDHNSSSGNGNGNGNGNGHGVGVGVGVGGDREEDYQEARSSRVPKEKGDKQTSTTDLSSTRQRRHPQDSYGYSFSSSSYLSNDNYNDGTNRIQRAKSNLLEALASSGGDVATSRFQNALQNLTSLYSTSDWDARHHPFQSLQQQQRQQQQQQLVDGSSIGSSDVTATGNNGRGMKRLEGTWLNLSRPHYPGCLGENENGDYLYTLGRMSFDMFRPTNLVCSIQGTFNTVRVVRPSDREVIESVPKSLKKELKEGESVLRTYNIVIAFTIEPSNPAYGANSPNQTVLRPIRGIMTTFGYALPDPSQPNRLSVWFTGGRMEINDEATDGPEWKRLFGGDVHDGREFSAKARLLAARVMLGAMPADVMESDGTMSFHFRRPIGGHGRSYVDVLYLDETLRVVRGSLGAVMVFARVPSLDDDGR